jgi:hypothetical protein
MASTGYNASTGLVTAPTVILDMGAAQAQNYPLRLSTTANYPGVVRNATHQRIANGGFFGGFSRFTPGYVNDGNYGEHYCGVGGIGGFAAQGDSTRFAMGMLIRFGTTLWDTLMLGETCKHIILVTNAVPQQRPMLIMKRSSPTGGTVVPGACNGTVCNTAPIGEIDYFNDNRQPDMRAKAGQWLWLELLFNSNTHITKTKVWSQDGLWNGVEIHAPWSADGAVSSQDVIGYWASVQTQGAQSYYDIEMIEYRVGSDASMTPPVGFPGSARNGILLGSEWTGWTQPNSTTVASSDGETEIGDALQTNFYPQMKRKKWNNLANFSIRLSLVDYLNPNKLACEGNKIIYTKGQYSAEFSFANGTFAFDIVLGALPPVNYLDFTVSKKDCTLYHQGVLNGSQPTNADQSLDVTVSTGVVRTAYRPANVINSIAIYGSVSGGQYETGKLGHLYRPLATDALGATTYCDWSIMVQDATTATIRLTCPQAFLNTATYPVRIK